LERASVHALLIDDDQGDYEFTRALMSQIEQYDITLDWVATYGEGVDSLSDHDYDVFFVDYFLEDRSGLDLLREARRRGVKTPMIMLTGRGSHDVDVEAMHSGASDYLVKGEIEPDNVDRCIRYALDRAEQFVRKIREAVVGKKGTTLRVRVLSEERKRAWREERNLTGLTPT